MQPKEKAAELIDKFMHIIPTKSSDYTHIYYPSAKQCALIVVDEILIIQGAYAGNRDEYKTYLDYWKEVKKELEHG